MVNGCEVGELDVEKEKDNQDRALLGNRPPYAHLAPVYRILPSLAPHIVSSNDHGPNPISRDAQAHR